MTESRDFWSRRKARVAAEAEAEAVALESRAIEAEQAERSDEEILSDLGLPEPETLGEGDDFSAFMAKAVPDRIRLRALRKLWLTNPVLANVDGLVDYGEDFTDAACVIENLQTTYQVGKGMQAHVEEMARQAELEAEAEDAPETEEPDAGEDELLAGAEEATELEEVALADDAPAADAMEAPEDVPAASRRRMRFRFDDQSGEVAQA